jgi:hypothetical protein
MASRRYRSQRTTAGQVDNLVKRLSYIEKRPTPKKLLARVVTTATVAPQAVTAPKLADNSVTSVAIAANAVTQTEIAANAVGSEQIIPGSIQASDVGFTAADIGANASLYSPTQPTSASVGDLWFDSSNGNKLSRYNGTSWVSVQDTAIAAANTAAAAANTAAVAANVAANAAQTTANSKNRVIRSTAAATGTSDAVSAFKSGDIWWQMDSTSATANVTGQWTFDGSKWNVNTITNSVIANLDAAKITTGYLAAGRIDANTITANMISANSITAAKIAANAVTAGAIAANSITAGTIAAGAVTATTISAGALNGQTITGSTFQTSASTAATRIVIDANQTDRILFYCSNGIAPGYIEAVNSVSLGGAATATGAGLYIYTPQFSGSTGIQGRPYIAMVNAQSGYNSYLQLVADTIRIGAVNLSIPNTLVDIGGYINVSNGGDTVSVSTTTINPEYIQVGTSRSLGTAGPVYAGSVPSSQKGYRAITYSQSAASGGFDGDMWLIYV